MAYSSSMTSSIPDARRAAAALQAVRAARQRDANQLVARSGMASMDLLLHAATNDDVVTARIFLEHGADVNVEDEKGWRPLHHAAYSGSHRVLQLLLNAPGVDVTGASNKGRRPIDACRTVEAARMLLDAGAVHAAAVPGVSLTALHHAAGQGRLEVVELLLDLGAKASETFSPKGAAEAFNHPGHFGGTALHLAALGLENARGQKKSLGASFGVYMPDLVSVHDAAERRVAVCAALLRAGADVNARTIPGPAPREQAPTSHNCRVTPLLLAAETGDAAVIKELLRAGAKADTVFGTPPNHCFSAMNAAAYFGHADAIRALVAAGADVDVRAVNGGKRAPLLDAVAQNHHSAVRALLELGADSTRMEGILALPVARRPRIFAENVMDETTRALLAQHRSGRLTPSRACSLPDCEARRRADYDDKKLLKCPCKLAYYCCREHQLLDRKRHKDACKAALAAQEPL